ncbi:MAG: hypothetical protein WCI45_07860 [Desulfuromonadales bacterium]|jgi:hypothetical protein
MNSKWKRPSKTELEQELQELITFANSWRDKAGVFEKELKQAQVMYLDSLAVIKYLEDKLKQQSKGKK